MAVCLTQDSCGRRSPMVFTAVAMLYGALDRRSSPLSPALRSLVTVRVSQINHCAFCVDINSATLAKRGVSMEKIDALAPGAKVCCSAPRNAWLWSMPKR